MKTLEYDLRYIQAGLEVLEKYLLSDEVFWPLSENPPDGEPDFPRFTLGGLFLSGTRLAAYQKSSAQQAQVERVMAELELIRSKWRSAWEKKATYCLGVRLRMWRDFIEEYQNNPHDHADRYVYEVRLRVMLQLLKLDIGTQNQAEAELLNGLDGYLKSVLEPGGFIWEKEIKSGFPSELYWYLYGYLLPAARKY
jgi:hypothetical protein